jgi:hypothetical protein
LTELRNKIVELRRKHAEATKLINCALLSGENTAPLRDDLAHLDRSIGLLEQEIADIAAERQAQAQDAISGAAAVIAADAGNSITSKLAALQPPDHP